MGRSWRDIIVDWMYMDAYTVAKAGMLFGQAARLPHAHVSILVYNVCV